MRYMKLLAGIACIVTGVGTAYAAAPIKPDSMGLSKGSVFGTPTPKTFHYSTLPPGQSTPLPRSYDGAPPQIPHNIRGLVPITANSNMCISCHARPNMWGSVRAKGMPTPIPPSHYTDLRNAPGKVSKNLVKARYNCTQCHVPQADVKPPIGNTFSSPR